MMPFQGLMDYDLRHGYRGAEKRLWQAKELAWSSERLSDYLDDLTSSDPFEPAVVVRIRDRQADVMLKRRAGRHLNWDGMKWARSFISDERQGPAPRKASDILHVGDLIWSGQWMTASCDWCRILDVNAALLP